MVNKLNEKYSCESAPEFDPEEVGVYPTGKTIARGLAELDEYLRKQEQKKAKNKKTKNKKALIPISEK